MKISLKGFRSGILRFQFGDPVGGQTAMRMCIYDQLDVLVADLLVDRAGATCGNKPCWKRLGNKGYRYKDPTASADGIQRILVKSGTNKAKIVVIGRNNAGKGQSSLPTGISPALTANSSATVRILTSDADCFGRTITKVKKNDAGQFKGSGS